MRVDLASSPFYDEFVSTLLSQSKDDQIDFAQVAFGPDGSIPGSIGGAKAPSAVIVLHEWWGVTPQVLAHAAVLAASGYRVLVPDLYRGELGMSTDEAQRLMRDLDFPAAVNEICHAAKYLKGEGARAVGVLGFNMGGALALAAAAKCAEVGCAVCCYGVNFGLFDPKELLGKPVQSHFGASDNMSGFSDLACARTLHITLHEAGHPCAEVFEYARGGHAFLNDDPAPFDSFEAREAKMGTPPFDKKEALVAWDRILGFFAQHLAGKAD
ncbi:hypothetical protein KFE25_005048 [Diacronema lutheri]|uniref:Dienelactone hydrolase domain-containing protein n=1 Tax=Diacronema lutheri TaxID=2081491 RepID=A0A8J5XB39_DIALT|nr:hypothetical protein KFE25_005048 [Diacronema lutheri]